MHLVDGVILAEDEGGGVRPVFEELFFLVDELVEVVTLVSAEAAPEHEVLGAFDGADGIDLEGADGAHDGHDAIAGGGRLGTSEVLAGDC